MDTTDYLSRLFNVLLEEVRRNPRLAAGVAEVFAPSSDAGDSLIRGSGEPRLPQSSRRHRRDAAVLDPLALYQSGEGVLRERLSALDVDQLKDIIAEHGMDTRKLAMKWKSTDRLVDLIATTVRDRLAKGSVFDRV